MGPWGHGPMVGMAGAARSRNGLPSPREACKPLFPPHPDQEEPTRTGSDWQAFWRAIVQSDTIMRHRPSVFCCVFRLALLSSDSWQGARGARAGRTGGVDWMAGNLTQAIVATAVRLSTRLARPSQWNKGVRGMGSRRDRRDR